MTTWTSPTEHVELDRIRDVAIVRLARPEKLNALTEDMLVALASAIRWAGTGSHARGVVVTGKGRAFSAGEDLDSVVADGELDVEAHLDHFHYLTRAVLDTTAPVVAALNGLVVGGAFEWVLSCDARLASQSVEILLPESRLGLTISNGSSYLLPRLVGARALPFVLDAPRIDVDAALRMGLIDRVVEADVVDAAVERVCEWTEPGRSTSAHLSLLRPSREEVEIAMRRETEAARSTWDSGISSAGVGGFLASRGPKQTRDWPTPDATAQPPSYGRGRLGLVTSPRPRSGDARDRRIRLLFDADQLEQAAAMSVAHLAPTVIAMRSSGYRRPGRTTGAGDRGGVMETIVVGVDGSPGAQAALEFATREAELRSAKLRIVCAWEIPAAAYAGGFAPALDQATLDSFRNRAETAVSEAVAAAKAQAPTVECESKAVHGQPAEVLLSEASDADLIVISNRGHGGFTSFLLGSVSHQVVQQARCPVTVVREPAPAESPPPD